MVGTGFSFTIPYQITLKDSVDQLRNKISRSITTEINKKFFSETTKTKIKLLIGEIIEQSIKNSDAYKDLKLESGKLRAHLGVENVDILDSIIEIWKANIGVVFNPGSGFLRVGDVLQRIIIIRAIKSDFGDILNETGTSYETDKGELIPWLEWLLLKGDKLLVPAFTVKRGIFKSPPSRTGYGIMVPTNNEGWRVPSEFKGTIDENFVTRAINGAELEFYAALTRILSEGFS
jgi:hypothetical protein